MTLPSSRFVGTTLALPLTVLLACGSPPPAPEDVAVPTPTVDTATRAAELARQFPIVDTHIDVPYRLRERPADISASTEGGDFDYPRAVAGGLDGAFMSIYVPADLEEGGAKELADELIDMVEGFAAADPDKFVLATSPADVEAVVGTGRVALPMGMENGAPIEGDLENLRHFHARGIRYVTLTHSKNNHLGDSSYETEDRWGGLSSFGHEAVAEMNRLGIMVDISHVDDPTARDVLEISKAPVIASHSSCRRYTPGFERNVSDELIQAIAANGGVVQINFGSAFLTEEANAASRARWDARGSFREEHGLEGDDPRVEEFDAEWRAAHPPVFADVSDVVAHIRHVVDLVGIEHVGIGSDYDGVGDSLPTGLKDVSTYPNLIAALLEDGFSEEDVRKIVGENVLRVWRRVDEVAAEMTNAATTS